MPRAKKTHFSDNHLYTLAGLFARSNMGMPRPSADDVRYEMNRDDGTDPRRRPNDLDSAITRFCQEYMETDADYKMFMREGRGWVRELKKMGKEGLLTNHPEIYNLAFPEA